MAVKNFRQAGDSFSVGVGLSVEDFGGLMDFVLVGVILITLPLRSCLTSSFRGSCSPVLLLSSSSSSSSTNTSSRASREGDASASRAGGKSKEDMLLVRRL